MKKFVILLSLALAAFSAAGASGNDVAMPFVRIQRDPVRAAFGGSGYAVRGSIAYSSLTNAATIPFSMEKLEVAAGYQYWEPSFSKTHTASVCAGWNIWNTFGFSLGATYGIGPAYSITDGNSISGGMFHPSELQLNFGAAWRFLDWLSIGANVHYASQTIMPSYTLYAVYSDIFLLGSVGGFTITAGVSSLGSHLMLKGDRNYSRNHRYDLPASASVGVAWHTVFSRTHGVDLNADLDWYFINEIGAGVGIGYTYRGRISVRAGGHYGKIIPPHISVGVGLRIAGGLNLDLCYLAAGKDSILRNTFCAGLKYSIRRYPRRR